MPEHDDNIGQAAVAANFLQFLSGMAAQTLMHLGVMANPLTGKAAVDLPNAKYSIDLLTVLKEKTEGNRTDEESGYLEAALYDLRLHYVRVASGGAAAGPDEAGAPADGDETAKA